MKMCKTFKILSDISQKRWREEKKKREKQISKKSKMEVLKILILVLRPFENSFATLNQRHFSSTGLRLSSRGLQIVFSHSLNFKSMIHGPRLQWVPVNMQTTSFHWGLFMPLICHIPKLGLPLGSGLFFHI